MFRPKLPPSSTGPEVVSALADASTPSSLGLLSADRGRLNRCRAVASRLDGYICRLLDSDAVKDRERADRLSHALLRFRRAIGDDLGVGVRAPVAESVREVYRQVYDCDRAAAYFDVDREVFARKSLQVGRFAEARRLVSRLDRRSALSLDVEFRMKCSLLAHSRRFWFPIFATLTVRNECKSALYGGGAWRKFVHALRRDLIHPDRAADSSLQVSDDLHVYGVLETGAETGRLHVHALILARWLPLLWRVDPCDGLVGSYNRELKAMRPDAYWPYGLSSFETFRSTYGDSWARIGHVWPAEKPRPGSPRARRMTVAQAGGRIPATPIPQVSLGRAAGYITKYLKKGAGEGGPKSWRVRITRGAGYDPLVPILTDYPFIALEVVRNPVGLRRRLPRYFRPSSDLLRKFALRALRPGLDAVTSAEVLAARLPDTYGKGIELDMVARIEALFPALTPYVGLTVGEHEQLRVDSERNCDAFLDANLPDFEVIVSRFCQEVPESREFRPRLKRAAERPALVPAAARSRPLSDSDRERISAKRSDSSSLDRRSSLYDRVFLGMFRSAVQALEVYQLHHRVLACDIGKVFDFYTDPDEATRLLQSLGPVVSFWRYLASHSRDVADVASTIGSSPPPDGPDGDILRFLAGDDPPAFRDPVPGPGVGSGPPSESVPSSQHVRRFYFSFARGVQAIGQARVYLRAISLDGDRPEVVDEFLRSESRDHRLLRGLAPLMLFWLYFIRLAGGLGELGPSD